MTREAKTNRQVGGESRRIWFQRPRTSVTALTYCQSSMMKVHGGYAELRTDALRFTESEIGELFRDIYNDPLEPAEVAELERRTEGWAASLQLVEVSLRERPSPEERRQFIHSITATKDSDLFDFLAEEVLD